ncbi:MULTISPECIES: hypothetical protein [unclassified Mucilaginibacter]|uniref:hypothetical protein n=1 Tax=unclassified Mucilaginibacter TaxID=2617802 RepID=UPI002AC93AB9|nr:MULTISPECIES: hypothetical protein [unclassified Mucilaginibacter]MEB0260268.1 hypothetical protein [Mucilaginibacter sp. 10I4]MEB0277321.1 hypothetical protein [Mucilaginibacter sp. 10B2]MEB0302172.1 hypothetical protein [Mucilaginibacter sp. 5C4]WPX25447.1 hypothetical protein RHM67_09235 [Mucilaginibacter sp. 5C4]
MEPDQEQPREASITKQIYTPAHIRFGTFLGGPLVAGYYLAENYKVFGEPGKAKATWIYAIAATIVICGGIISYAETVKIPSVVFPIAYCWVAFYLTEYFQGTQINAHGKSGEGFFGWGRVILVSLIGVAITLAGIYIGVIITGD